MLVLQFSSIHLYYQFHVVTPVAGLGHTDFGKLGTLILSTPTSSDKEINSKVERGDVPTLRDAPLQSPVCGMSVHQV